MKVQLVFVLGVLSTGTLHAERPNQAEDWAIEMAAKIKTLELEGLNIKKDTTAVLAELQNINKALFELSYLRASAGEKLRLVDHKDTDLRANWASVLKQIDFQFNNLKAREMKFAERRAGFYLESGKWALHQNEIDEGSTAAAGYLAKISEELKALESSSKDSKDIDPKRIELNASLSMAQLNYDYWEVIQRKIAEQEADRLIKKINDLLPSTNLLSHAGIMLNISTNVPAPVGESTNAPASPNVAPIEFIK